MGLSWDFVGTLLEEKLLQNDQDKSSAASLEVMRSLSGKLEVVGGVDPFAQTFDPKTLANEVANVE